MPEEEPLRERIIAAAFDRFRSEGFARVPVDDLAAHLSISKKTFYKVFTSKDALIENMVDTLLRDVRNNTERIISSDEEFIGKLSALMAYMGSLLTRVGLPMMQDLSRHRPDQWKRIEDFRARRLPDVFLRLLQQGIREGHVRPDLQKRIFLLAYMAAVQHIMQPSVLANESFSAREAITGIVELFFQGVLTDRGRKELARTELHLSTLAP